jgi:hypothetical protein
MFYMSPLRVDCTPLLPERFFKALARHSQPMHAVLNSAADPDVCHDDLRLASPLCVRVAHDRVPPVPTPQHLVRGPWEPVSQSVSQSARTCLASTPLLIGISGFVSGLGFPGLYRCRGRNNLKTPSQENGTACMRSWQPPIAKPEMDSP